MSCRRHTKGGKSGVAPPVTRSGHDETARLRDLLIYCLIGLGQVAAAGMKRGIKSQVAGIFMARAAMSTLENFTPDLQRFGALIHQGVVLRDQLKGRILASNRGETFPRGPADFEPATTLGGLMHQARRMGSASYPARTAEILALKQILILGVQGVAAWVDHAQTLGRKDEALFEALVQNLSAVYQEGLVREDLITLVRALGKTAQRSMALQDEAMADAFGRPGPVTVPLGVHKGRAILVSGRDFHTLEALLRQSEGQGIFIYTTGEMLGAHQFPGLRRYDCLGGHLQGLGEDGGPAFAARFPGAVLLTGRGQMPAEPIHGASLFAAAPAFGAGIPQITRADFSPLISRARAMPGFARDDIRGRVRVGWSRKALESAGRRMAELYRKGRLERILLKAACGGAAPVGVNALEAEHPGRTVMITLSCCGGRLRQQAALTLPGILDRIDLGEGQDAHGVIQTVLSLAEALGRDVADLPLTLILDWSGFEMLPLALAFFYLGVQDIRLTRRAPVSPALLRVLGHPFHEFD